MAITRTDCILLLTDLQEKGIDVKKQIESIMKNDITKDVITFINQNRQLDLSMFYEKLRKSYNNKKSKLYKQIVISDEVDSPTDVIKTLSALLTQIVIFSDTAEDRDMFLKHARADEICLVLSKYFREFDITTCVKLLRIIKSDLKALEMCK